jgi:hypothetical protein
MREGGPRRTPWTELHTPVCSYTIERLSPQFQFSLSGVTLVYLSQWYYSTVQYKHSHHFRLADTLTGPENDKHYQLYTVYVFLVSESS